MYSHAHATMAPPQRSVAPETFLLAEDAQQSLPPEAIVALQQVDNCKYYYVLCFVLRILFGSRLRMLLTAIISVKYFLISAPVDWSPDQYIRRFLLPTGEYVSCVLW